MILLTEQREGSGWSETSKPPVSILPRLWPLNAGRAPGTGPSGPIKKKSDTKGGWVTKIHFTLTAHQGLRVHTRPGCGL